MSYIELNLLSTEELIKVKNEEIKRIDSNEQARQQLIQGILFLQTIEDQRVRGKDNG